MPSTHRPILRVCPGCLLALCFILTAAPGRAQQRVEQPLALARVHDGAITLDGWSDETAWETVEPLPLTVYQPFGEDLTERSEIRVAYDDGYLYAAARFYDSEPGAIRSNSLYRDRYSGDDTFGLVLDTFNDNENALWFYTSPAGVRFDTAVANDAESNGSGRPTNASWNTHWDVATVHTGDGWFAEMRIPYSSLGFQAHEGRVTMGLIAYRFIARKNERQIFPAIPPNWGMGFAKPSVAQDVVLEGVAAQRPAYVTPYALGGFTRAARLDDAETAYRVTDDATHDLGLDLKYNLTNNLTLDATLNTDFAQVEADDQQVNLTRFSLFFPEKRQFFQERAGIFDFTFGGSDRLFHSRRIGLHDDEPVRLLGGARLVGRVGPWDVGLLDLQTARSPALPSENFGVARLRRQVLNPYSYAGGMVTSRLGDDGTYNVAYGLDGVFRFSEDRYLTAKWAQTFEDDAIQARGFNPAEAGLLFAQWENRTRRGPGYSLRFSRIGADFQPEVGFSRRAGVTALSGWLRYGFMPGAGGSANWFAPGTWAEVYVRNDDRTVESVEWSIWYYREQRSGATVNPWIGVYYEDLREPLDFPDDTVVPVGRYPFVTLNAGYDMAQGRLLRTSVDLGAGTFFDGWQTTLSLEPTWNVSRYLELGAVYEISRIRFPNRDQGFDAHVFRIRTQTALNTRVSAHAFLQYNSIADVVSANLRFRYNMAEGSDLWIVYNEGRHTDRRAYPTPPLTGDRVVLVKYTYTFAL